MTTKDSDAGATPLDVTSLATLPLHELAAFEAAARLGSFARAAEELCVTQSAVSHRIRQLEGRLGGALFERAGKAARLLPLGQRCLAPVAEGLGRLRQATAAIDDTERRLVRLAVTAALGTQWLMPHIARFMQQHVDVRTEISPSASADDAAAGTADVTLGFDEARPDGAAAFQVVLRLVCAPPLLAQHGPFDTVQRLRAAPWLRHPQFSGARWMRAAFGVDAEPLGIDQFDDTVAMLEAAAGGLGLALCPALACGPYEQAGLLVRAHPVELTGFACTARLSEAGAVKPAARAFAEWLARQVA